MNVTELNRRLLCTRTMYQVHMVAVDTTNGDCKAVFGWYEVTGKNEPWEPLFTAPTVVTLIAKAKEELGTRFIREHGLDGVVPADTLRTGKVKPDSSDLFFSHLHK